MGPQRSTAAVVAAGLAVIAAIVVVAWVALQPRATGRPTKASADASATAVGMPEAIDETFFVPTLMTVEAIPAGTTLGEARAARLVAETLVPKAMAPEDDVMLSTISDATVFGAPLDPGIVLTEAAMTARSPAATTSSSAPCPKAWAGTPAPGDRVVFIVTAPVAQGTTVAEAFANGALRPYAVGEKWVPPTAPGALGAVCNRVAAFDLTSGTVLMSGTFVAP